MTELRSPVPADVTLQDALALLEARPLASVDALLDLLRENAPHFRGRSTGEAERLRAFLLARIAASGFAPSLTAFALEDLQTGQSAYALAAAARALRLSGRIPDEAIALLARAVRRLLARDEFVDLERYPPTRQAETTALAEVVRALQQGGSRAESHIEHLQQIADARTGMDPTVARLLLEESAPCCCGSAGDSDPEHRNSNQISGSLKPLLELEVQDQDGKTATLGELFLGRTSLLSFFYTRCMNPLKCSRTISQMAALRTRLDAEGCQPVLLAALTYDPAFDLPYRLARYGRDRGVTFSEDCLLLRTIGPFQPIAEHLGLGVGYGDSTVNAHRIEWLVTDLNGDIAVSNSRRHWDLDQQTSLLKDLAGC